MFMITPDPQPQVKDLLDQFETKSGSIPPHFMLLATVNPKRFEMFLAEISYLLQHPNINPDLFAFLRLFIAHKEQFSYCLMFNTKLLLAKGYEKNVLHAVKEDITAIPLDERHQLLAQKAVKAVYQGEAFHSSDYQELKDAAWSDSDIYDAIDHAAFLFKNAKILKAYSA